jgi:hypothetical protein
VRWKKEDRRARYVREVYCEKRLRGRVLVCDGGLEAENGNSIQASRFKYAKGAGARTGVK